MDGGFREVGRRAADSVAPLAAARLVGRSTATDDDLRPRPGHRGGCYAHDHVADGDPQLLEAWRSGSASAGQELVRRYFDSVYRFFANKAPAAAEDLVQETFLAIVEGRGRVREDAALHGYIFAVARRRLYRFWRDRTGAAPETRTTDELCGTQPALCDALACHQEHKLLLKALRRLPLHVQVMLELAYFEGMTDRALADFEGLPVGTLKSRLRKARGDLEAAMEQIGGVDLLESTTQDFEGWVASLRQRMRVSQTSPPPVTG